MGLFYNASDKEILEVRNKIFVERGIPALIKNGFKKSPFSTAWFGRNNLKDFTYELCRLNNGLNLEIITVHISRGDSRIKIFLNIFVLKPQLESLDQLNGVSGLRFCIPPNSITQMHLRIDDYKGIPLFRSIEHKIKSYNSKESLRRRVNELGELIEKDMINIDYFVKRWHEIHKPMITTWEGHQIYE